MKKVKKKYATNKHYVSELPLDYFCKDPEHNEMFKAVVNNNSGKLQTLIDSGVDINYLTDLQPPTTAFHIASFLKREKILKILLKALKIKNNKTIITIK